MSDESSSDSVVDQFTETTHKSWFSRIIDSIKGVLFGLALVAAACFLLFWNEGRAVQTHKSLLEGEGTVVETDAARIDPANEGRLVYITGDLKAPAPVADPQFGIAASGLRLVRSVEMYQWKETEKQETRKNVGGSEDTVTTYSYSYVWSDSRIDSSRFRQSAGHSNPMMRYSGATTYARDAAIGAFRPGNPVLQLLPARQTVPVTQADADALRGKVDGPARASGELLYLGDNPNSPRVGDLRISYTVAPNGPASIIGRQSGTDLTRFQTKAGDALLMARPGNPTAMEMFKQAEQENRMLTWLLRLAGVVMMFIGFAMILNPLVIVADVVPLIGSILGAGAALVSGLLTAVLAPVVIAIAWLWYRPIVSVVALVIGAGAAYGFKVLAARKAATKAAARGAAQPVPRPA